VHGTVSIDQKEYPPLLKLISGAPKQLYYKGNWRSDVFENCLAVVGSRRMNLYGKKVIKHIFSQLCSDRLTIVSGFMYGVDIEAHCMALEMGLPTIAVMPCGIEKICPDDMKVLYEQILDSNGLVVSEFPNDFAPQVWTYPKRNRIIAGLSKAVLVVEAAVKSGSLITANFAHDFKREVFTVPGDIFSYVLEGNLQLLSTFAKIAYSGSCINKFFGFDSFELEKSLKKTEKSCLGYRPMGGAGYCPLEREIINLIKDEPLTFDELSAVITVPTNELSSKITLLLVRGTISEEGGKYYAG
jgi:DNA processing protein